MGLKKLLRWSGTLSAGGSETVRFQNHVDFNTEDILHFSIWRTSSLDISEYRDIQVIIKGIHYPEAFEEFFPAYAVEIPLPFEFVELGAGQRYNRLVYKDGLWIGEQLDTLILSDTRKVEILLKNNGTNDLPFIFLIHLERRKVPMPWF